MAARKVAKAELSILDKVVAALPKADTKRMTDTELASYVVDNFDKVSSKNGMLKLLRSEGLSCSMSRVFDMYVLVAKQMPKAEAKESEA